MAAVAWLCYHQRWFRPDSNVVSSAAAARWLAACCMRVWLCARNNMAYEKQRQHTPGESDRSMTKAENNRIA